MRNPPPEWMYSDRPVAYEDAHALMEQRVADIRDGKEAELVWLLEHPPLYTSGTSANEQDLLDPKRFPVYETGRGGEYTYHGPGQRVAYVMLDLKNGNNPTDLKAYVRNLEQWVINTLKSFGINGERREGRVGIWVVDENGKESKIAAIGIRVRKWVSYHGIAINVCPDLTHFNGIVPCGIQEHGVTSLKEQGVDVTMDEVDLALKKAFFEVF